MANVMKCRFVAALLLVKGQLLSAGGDPNILVWDMATYKKIKAVDVSEMKAYALVKPEKLPSAPLGRKGKKSKGKKKADVAEEEVDKMEIEVSPAAESAELESTAAEPTEEEVVMRTEKVVPEAVIEERETKHVIIRKMLCVKEDLIVLMSTG